MTMIKSREAWPELDYPAWRETAHGLHLRMQIVGKIRLVRTPWTNHSWHVPFYVTARGLTTSLIPEKSRQFQIDFDFIDHSLIAQTSDGAGFSLPLRPQSIAECYGELFGRLRGIGIDVAIHTMPSELADAVPFDQDHALRPYDAEAAQRFWQVLVQSDRVLKRFRAGFIGKCSPVHVFWGSFDMAVTRFSGRGAPPHPGGVPNLPDWVAREAYSHEVSSAGFWPGGGATDYPAYYSYAYPAPDGFEREPVQPAAAFYHPELREFILPYEVVRQSPDPDETLLSFLESTYAAAARRAGWDRNSLERSLAKPID